ncbi:ABC transporter substrate-binding protein [Pseudonocardia sp. CA-142604]|uniref:ABC transporter substrate-binding protein n=1 Tax=Pseudonocardia sp. CA-142604 TaxID=3240024 RepID=UPI003D8E7C44
MDREPVALDPVVPGSQQAIYAIYDPLMRVNEKRELVPYLAESMTTADGGKTWILKLRPGVQFQDGTPLDADAVLFNLKRQQDTVRSPGNVYAKQIASMTAVDDLTVEFVLQEAFGSFANAFALRSNDGSLGLMASPTAIQKWGDDYARHPVGAGPFEFVEWKPDSRIVVKKFENYWQKDKGLPYLDGIEFRPLPDTDSAYASLENGDIDMLFCSYQTSLVRASKNPDLVTYYYPGNGGEYLYFNFTKAPFDDRRMREAVLAALNPQAMSATLYQGYMEPAQTPFAPDSSYFSQEAADQYPKYDPERARQLIAEYKADGGDPNFTLSSANNPTRAQFAEFVQAQWAAVGINVKLDLQDLATFSSAVVQGGNFQMTTWVSGWPDPFPNLLQLLRTGGSGNYGDYSNPQVDSLLLDAVSTTDQEKRIEDYKQVQLIAGQDLAIGWYSRASTGILTNKSVKGVVLDVPTGPQMWATAWLAR